MMPIERTDFPFFNNKVHGKPMVYFDNAATTQKPQAVLDALTHFYTHDNAAVYRSMHTFAERATQLYEHARQTVADFIGAAHAQEIIFTRNTTESINLVASTWAHKHLHEGDEILLSELEHHANIVPWQHLAQQKGLVLVYIPVNADGTLQYEMVPQLLSPRTKLVAITHSSNALGTHVDVGNIIRAAHAVGARVLVDAAQTVAHETIDVQKMQCDFLAFSGHKVLGPTGIGVLYITRSLHDDIPPYQFGGGMVRTVTWDHATYLPLPHRLEAGTSAIAQAIGLGAALTYVREHVNYDALQKHEAALCTQLIEGLSHIPRITVLGPTEQLKRKGHLVSFSVQGMHAHDVAAYLDSRGICVRAGHQCAQPLAKKMGLDAAVRASFYGYNTSDEVALLVDAIKQLPTL